MHSPKEKQMKKIASLVAALSLSLLLSTAAFGGEILTPGATPPPPPPAAESVQAEQEVTGLAESTGDALLGMEFIYDLLLMVF